MFTKFLKIPTTASHPKHYQPSVKAYTLMSTNNLRRVPP
jgi:hypothetical protein